MEFGANHLSDLDKELAAIERDLERHSALESMTSTADFSGFSGALTTNDIAAMQAPMAGIEDFDRRINVLLAKAAAIDGIEAGIEHMGKISLRDVSSLEKLVPGMIYRNGVDSSQFTLNPSTQGYAAGLEAINWAKVGKWGVIGALVAAIIAIIARLLGRKNQPGVEERVAENVNRAADQQDDLDEMMKAAKEGAARARAELDEEYRKAEEARQRRQDERRDQRAAEDIARKEKNREHHTKLAISSFMDYLTSNPTKYDPRLIPKAEKDLLTARIEDILTNDAIALARDNFVWRGGSAAFAQTYDTIHAAGSKTADMDKLLSERRWLFRMIEPLTTTLDSTLELMKKLPKEPTAGYGQHVTALLNIAWKYLVGMEPSVSNFRSVVAQCNGTFELDKENIPSLLEQISALTPTYRSALRVSTWPALRPDKLRELSGIISTNSSLARGDFAAKFEEYHKSLLSVSTKNTSNWDDIYNAFKEHTSEWSDHSARTEIKATLDEYRKLYNDTLDVLVKYMHYCQNTLVLQVKVLNRTELAISALLAHQRDIKAFTTFQSNISLAMTPDD